MYLSLQWYYPDHCNTNESHQNGRKYYIVFTTVLDELSLGTIEEDQDASPTDRNYWQNKCGKEMLTLCDNIKEDINQFAPGFELKYNKFYIGISKEGIPKNFVSMTPRKTNVLLNLRIEQNEDTSNQLQATDLEILSYDRQWKQYRMKLNKGGYEKNRELLKELMTKAYGEYPF